MRILVTGKNGQLVQSLQERAPAFGAEIVALGRPEFDLAEARRGLDLVGKARPDLIVSAAAYTAVDKAESEPELAFAVNAEGPRALADAAAALGVPVIQISTDYVFDGTKPTPWTEADEPAPVSVYGASKLAGERAVLAASPRNVVIRVGWVYSPFGANFAKTILRLAGERDVLRIVGDQIGGPSSALDIADGVLTVARNVLAEPSRDDLRGVFHMGAGGGAGREASWADFASEICDWLALRTGRKVVVEKITTGEYPTKARRPANSRLDSSRLAAAHGFRMPPWRGSVAPVLARLVQG
jgi:dTDP-4-dehydrorhamnose reductase